MALVGAYNFDVLTSGKIRDQSCYSRDITLDAGVSLTAGKNGLALDCSTAGGRGEVGAGDYARSNNFHMHAWVKSTDATAGVRIVSAMPVSTVIAQALLLSDASGYVAGIVDGVTYSSTTSVRDGAWHHISFNHFNGALTITVDGVSVWTGTRSGVYTVGEYYTVGRGTSATANVAKAIIDDLRWFNDPVIPTEISGRFMGLAVYDMLLAAYNFDSSSAGVIADQSIYGRNLTLTANGSLVTGHNGNAVKPTASSSNSATNLDINLGDFDRLNVSMWVRIDSTGSATPFLSIEDSAGSPLFQLFRGGSLGLLMKSWRSDDGSAGTYLYGPDNTFVVGTWIHIAVDINPTGWNFHVNGAYYAGGTNGNQPTNDPIITGLDRLRVGGDASNGIATIDDLRIIRNYLNPAAITSLMNAPVTTIPRGTLNKTFLGTLQPSSYRLGASPVGAIYVGTTKVYG